MISVMAQMGLLMICGVMWRIIKPGGLDADTTRIILTTVVFNLLLPVLVLSILWRAEIGIESLKISCFGIGIILCGAALTWTISRFWHIRQKQLGAVMLAIAFPNVTYLGLPVLEQSLGAWTRSIVIQMDLFAAMPTLLTFGVFIARHYGEDDGKHPSVLWALLKNPPLWSAFLAVFLNLSGIEQPVWLLQAMEKLAAACIPLMLVSLGLGLRFDAWRLKNLRLCMLVSVFKLMVVPFWGIALAMRLGFSGDKLTALVMDAAMPSMLLGIVYCDRYKLDTGFYAMAIVMSTLFSMISLPFLFGFLSGG